MNFRERRDLCRKNLEKMRIAMQKAQKKADAITSANIINKKIGDIPMTNLQKASNINKNFVDIIESHIEATSNKISLSTSDIDLIEQLIENGKIKEARRYLTNVKSVAKIINERIMVVDSYLQSFEL